MRILAVNWLDLENPQAGGAEIHLFEILKRLVAGGDQVTLIASGWPGAPPHAEIDGIEVHRFAGRHSFALAGRGAVRRALDAATWDVLIEDINKLPLYLATMTRLPMYVIIPHLFGTAAFREASPPVAAVVWTAERLIPRVYRRAAFHAISDSTRDDLVARGIPPETIRVVYPGVDAVTFAPDPATPKTEDPSFLYVGRLKRYKGIDLAVRALAALRVDIPEAPLQIAGEGDDRGRLEGIVRASGVGEGVRFLGFVDETQKVQLMRESWAMVFPSAKEGWGITNVEAAACGTLAIAADSPGLRESVIDDETGLLVKHGNVTALSSAMKRVAQEPGLLDRFAPRARAFAERLTWDETVRRTREHLYETVEKT